MYTETKAFPMKWVIVIAAVLVLIIGIIAFSSYQKNKLEKNYKDLIAKIEKAGEEYGRKHMKQIQEMEEECVTLEILMKEGLLVSDSKKEPILIDPKSKEKMTGKVHVKYGGFDDILSKYLDDGICRISYEDKVKIAITDVTTHSFVVKIEAPEGLRLNAFEYKLNDGEYFKHDLPQPLYRFDELLTGKYKVFVKATDYLGLEYNREASVELEELVKPEIVVDAETNIATINCPEVDDEEVICSYTVDSEEWVKVTPEEKEYEFTESGKIIAVVTDGYNKTEPVTEEVTVIPACVDTEWSVCSGCTAECGSTCKGIETSNCENTRECEIVGVCEVSSSSSAPIIPSTAVPKPVTYTVTVKASNGNPATQQKTVNAGENVTFGVSPSSNYQYSSVKCSVGTASYSTRNKVLTVSRVNSPVTCTVYFTKIIPLSYTVSFYGFQGKLLGSKKVVSGNTVSPMTAPTITGYKFVGWMRNGKLYNFSTKVYSNMSLSANYNGDYVTVKFNTSGGTHIADQQIIRGKTAARPAINPKRAAYHFDNWHYNGSVYNFSNPVNTSITIDANWLPLMSKTLYFDGSNNTQSTDLVNYRGLEEITTTCSGQITRTMSGNRITIRINSIQTCKVNILYY
ncbi:MAG: InlB B-repeat-containing protein [Mollicutes bacterium]|jgi:hypothetical protein|nr:InlB B-repeat-containing protein [Mollicutes bacterium]